MSDPAPSRRDVDRRRQLIEATIATIAQRGYRAATIAAIAETAGVSAGLVAFHFGDKDGLLEATLLHLVAELQREHLARLAGAQDPRARINAIIDATLSDGQFDRATAAVWLAFWAEVPTNPRFARLQRLYARRTRSNLTHAFAALAPRPRRPPPRRRHRRPHRRLLAQRHARRPSRRRRGSRPRRRLRRHANRAARPAALALDNHRNSRVTLRSTTGTTLLQ